jgi:hypothetical protein
MSPISYGQLPSTKTLPMNINLPNLHLPSMIPVNSAAITITTSFAEEADQLTDLKKYFQVYSHLVSLLNDDDTEEVVNWYDGRPKSMFLTIWTRNQAAMRYAFSEDLVDEDLTIESSIRDYLQSQEICCECIEAVIDEFITSQVTLKQSADGRLSVDFGGDLVGI